MVGHVPTAATRQQLSKARSGRKHSPKSIEKMSGENSHMYGKTGEKHHNTLPEYMQVYWDFITYQPLGLKKTRKHLSEKWCDIPKNTIRKWISKWRKDFL